jgi:phage terminase small subunit
MAGLTPRKESFALEYIRTGSAKASAIAAGYSPKSASTSAARLLKDPVVTAFIDAARERSIAVAQYTATEAMRELEDGMRFARETKNATALARLIELRMKQSGLLVERSDVRMLGGFQIKISGIDYPHPAESEAATTVAAGVVQGVSSTGQSE